MVSALDCQIYDRGTIPAPDFSFRVALPVHPAENGYRDLPWKLNAAERSTDHIASLCAEICKRWTTNTHCRKMSTWACPSGAAKFDFLRLTIAEEQLPSREAEEDKDCSAEDRSGTSLFSK